MVVTKLFKSNKSQAVRLPKAVAFPDDVTEVEIIKVGANRMIVPKGKSWTEFFENGPLVSDDFTRGEDLPPQERDWF
ncbi:type II toxin-antitoxin system VapB family antitoxin [Oryzibacter oryziterrae]|uniref:type II toxin-antitoxin system VapB family antitoxin n=1 Tax=Oryzibacter oryziterrae TaxID=2766474 RepID=UPI001F398B43|nr:type II toxin-antitoxin system VapB family antitoxin [Oryzibacter oryziterrae]